MEQYISPNVVSWICWFNTSRLSREKNEGREETLIEWYRSTDSTPALRVIDCPVAKQRIGLFTDEQVATRTQDADDLLCGCLRHRVDEMLQYIKCKDEVDR